MWQTCAAIVAGVATLALIILVVDRYGADLTRTNWALVSLLCALVFVATVIYRWNEIAPGYEVMDLLMNPQTGKADPYRHLMFFFAGLTAWAIVQVVLAKEWTTLTPLLLGALGFFVAKPTLDGFANALGRRGRDDDGHVD